MTKKKDGMKDYSRIRPEEAWEAIRNGSFNSSTAGVSLGFAQANLVVLPKNSAYEFLLFCLKNPKPCPVLDVTEPGSYEPIYAGPRADMRTDIPHYRIYKDGKFIEELENIKALWTDDMVAFLLGCSLSFEGALLNAGIPVRHIEENHSVPMYISNIQCRPAGRFHGPIVVSMRPIPYWQVTKTVLITSRFPSFHGAPLHIGEPGLIGINDLSSPDFGEPVKINEGEVPVFWACGVTPQAVAMKSRLPFMITHAPGQMFISTIRDEDLAL